VVWFVVVRNNGGLGSRDLGESGGAEEI